MMKNRFLTAFAFAGLIGFVWYLNQRIEDQRAELSTAMVVSGRMPFAVVA